MDSKKRFKLTRVGPVIHEWLLKDIHIVNLEALPILGNDLLKLNNAINTCLI